MVRGWAGLVHDCEQKRLIALTLGLISPLKFLGETIKKQKNLKILLSSFWVLSWLDAAGAEFLSVRSRFLRPR